MKTARRSLGPLEIQFFAWTQFNEREQVRTGDLVQALKLTQKQETDLLYKLATRGFILKIWRGFYLVPKRLPPGQSWNPSPYLIIAKCMEQKEARFQVSGPAVFNLYGYSEQVSSQFVIYNDRLSKKLKLLQYQFNFVKVPEKRLGETKLYSPPGRETPTEIILSSRERALFDAVYDYRRFGTLPQAYSWIRKAIQKKQITPGQLVKITAKFGNTMTQKRMGWLLEKEFRSKSSIQSLRKKIPKNQFLVPLNPQTNQGKINRQWGVIENVQLPT